MHVRCGLCVLKYVLIYVLKYVLIYVMKYVLMYVLKYLLIYVMKCVLMYVFCMFFIRGFNNGDGAIIVGMSLRVHVDVNCLLL